jgi:hypothetical protein
MTELIQKRKSGSKVNRLKEELEQRKEELFATNRLIFSIFTWVKENNTPEQVEDFKQLLKQEGMTK